MSYSVIDGLVIDFFKQYNRKNMGINLPTYSTYTQSFNFYCTSWASV